MVRSKKLVLSSVLKAMTLSTSCAKMFYSYCSSLLLIFIYQPKKFSDEIDKAIEDIRACKITCWHKWYASRELSAVALAQCNIFQACFACVTALTTGWYAGAVLCVHLLETAQTQECGFIVQCCLPFQCTNSKNITGMTAYDNMNHTKLSRLIS